jgi:hypothetical protein
MLLHTVYMLLSCTVSPRGARLNAVLTYIYTCSGLIALRCAHLRIYRLADNVLTYNTIILCRANTGSRK